MGTEEGLGAFLVAEKGLGAAQSIPTESIVRCNQCQEPETDLEGCCCICEKCSLCCGCETFNTLSAEEQLDHDDPTHVCHYHCHAWEDPDWPKSCGDED